jgi:O-antigen/teichoic acid export membrane protein
VAPPRERSFGANAVLTAFSWAVPALAALIATPITVRGLGADQYGLLALAAAITGYLGLMEMGLGSAVVRYVAYFRALEQGRPLRAVIWFSVRWFCAAGFVGLVFLWIAAPWLSASVLKMPPDLMSTSITVMRITGVNFLVALLVSVGMAIPQSFLRYDIASVLSAAIGTISAVGPAVIVSLGYGLVPVVWFALGLNLAALLIYCIVGYRLVRLIPASEGPPWKEVRRKTMSFAGIVALNRVGDTVAGQTNRVVVGIASGVAAAAYYQVPAQLASRVNDMISRVAQVVFPTASGLLARGDQQAVQQLYLRTSRLFFLLNASVTMGLCVLSYPLLEYWVSPTFAQQSSVALTLFSLSQALHGVTMSASYVNMSAARPGINMTFSNLGDVINLAVVYPLTVHYGINGAAFAGLIAALNVPFFLDYGHRRVLHLSSWLVWRRCYQPIFIGTGLTGIAAYFLLRPLCHNLPATLAAWCLIVLVSSLISGLLGGVSRADLRTGRRLLASAWKPVRGLLR